MTIKSGIGPAKNTDYKAEQISVVVEPLKTPRTMLIIIINYVIETAKLQDGMGWTENEIAHKVIYLICK